jgi:hypothetical protein
MEKLIEEFERLVARKAAEITKKEELFKEKYEHLESMLRGCIDDAKVIHAEMRENNLTAGAIEAEGFLRFALNVESMLDEQN